MFFRTGCIQLPRMSKKFSVHKSDSDVSASSVFFSVCECCVLGRGMRRHIDFFTKLKDFDAYPKTLEDFRVRTFSGAAGKER